MNKTEEHENSNIEMRLTKESRKWCLNEEMCVRDDISTIDISRRRETMVGSIGIVSQVQRYKCYPQCVGGRAIIC